MASRTLNRANKAKNDEFYTQIADIERECLHYREHFKGKVVFCNCDDPDTSDFWRYFHIAFSVLELKKLIATHFVYMDLFTPGETYKIEYEGGDDGDFNVGKRTALEQNGDFRSFECIELLKEADIVVTNPPFSLFREYVAQLIKYDKKFLIIGSQNAIAYKEIFKLIKENKIWLGRYNGGNKWFRVPPHYEIESEKRIKVEKGIKYFSMGSTIWLTNMEHKRRHENLILYRQYKAHEDEYPKYDNYDAIEVSKVENIPIDYDGVMGVPITFLDKYNPSQFEVVGSNRGIDQDPNGIYGRGSFLNGKETFKRLFIKRRSL